MNAWSLNGRAGYFFKEAVVRSLDIEWKDIYKMVKSIDSDGTITIRSGKKYKLVMEEIN